MNSFSQNCTIVLVHGAWADGSCWKDVILPLERQGLKVVCAPIPLTSLSEDVSALTRTLERTSGHVVLAGHAYGGAVIGAIHEERVKFMSQRSRPMRAKQSRRSFITTSPMPKHRSWHRTNMTSSGCRKTDLAGQSPIRLQPTGQKSWPRCSDQFMFGAFKRRRLCRDGRPSRPGFCLRKRTA